MSTERGDSTYQPGRLRKKQTVPQTRHPVRTTRNDRDYAELLVISDDSDDTVQGENTLGGSDSEDREDTYSVESISVKREPWTPQTLASRTDSLLKNITAFTEQTALFKIAEGPDTSIAEVMQMMLKM